MKPLLLTLGLGLLASKVYAQGTVSMNTIGAGVNAVATLDFCGNRPVGTAYKAQLFWGPPNIFNDAFLQPIGAVANFGTGSFAGYINTASGGGNRVLPIPGNLGPASQVTLQIRVWSAVLGMDYDTAFANWNSMPPTPGLVVGKSGTVQVQLTEPPTPTAVLTGLLPYRMGPISGECVPEPSVLALGLFGLGGGLLLSRRRR